jgi:hypothetical protein
MSRRHRDSRTMDLLSWQPPAVVKSFPPEKVRAANLRSTIAKAISLSMKECSLPRDQVAVVVSDWLGERCTEAMLNAFASEARDDHMPSLVRFIAIAHATGDAQRLLQAIAELFDLAVIQSRYVPAIEDAMLADQVEELKQRQQLKRREWKGNR